MLLQKSIPLQLLFPVFLIFAFSCSTNSAIKEPTGIQKAVWGVVDGKQVYLFTLTNRNGNQIKISNYGGTITSWVVQDKDGSEKNIVLGFDSLSGYLAKPPYFGATIGRYGNRIAGGKFKLHDSLYILATNNGINHLHGGLKGFDKVVWDPKTVADSIPKLILSYLSKDHEEGYPGNLTVRVEFSLNDSNTLSIEYFAETDKATPVNLTNHSYFNLSGDVNNDILQETLQINAGNYTPVDSTLIPTGEINPVEKTNFDFTQPHKIGERIAQIPGGYDHNYVLDSKGDISKEAVRLTDVLTGIDLSIYTAEPGIQFYSGNFLDGKIKNRDGKPINQHAALCLEPQHFPNSPNQSTFPNTILEPGEKYHTLSKYRIMLEK